MDAGRMEMTNYMEKRLGVLAAGLMLQGVCGAAPANHSGLWWNPAEAGWGVAIEQQGKVVSAVMATYDPLGQPVWFILPRAEQGALDASDAAAPVTFEGAYYRTQGVPDLDICTRCGDPPLFPPNVAVTELGAASFVFNPDGGGTFMSPTTALRAKSITRDVFASAESSCGDGASSGPSTNYQGFWANASESGWGLYLAHQADVIFGIWLTYAANGNPLWYSMPLTKNEGNSYSGPIVFSTGPSYADPLYDATMVGVMEVGSATMTFDDRDNGHLEYQLPGLYSGTRDVARQVFDASAENALCD
jgi:hypothetical protein